MADRLRRQKDIITRNTDAYIEATTKDYAKYYEGTPTYITYYSIDKDSSTEDIGLEAVNSLTGADAPIKYRKISDVKIYGIDALDVSNEITERGLQSNVSGEFVMRPDSGIVPVSGDFFSFVYTGMEEHLFKINDVQFDKITPNKYYKCTFSLYPYNLDDIYNNIAGNYNVEYNDDGTAVVEESTSKTNEATKTLIDSMIDKYESMFYDEDMDMFSYYDPTRTKNFWSPYLQHFLHETKCLSRYNRELLTEIYISDINEPEYPKIYSERAYRNSIFRNIQIQNPNVTFDQTFLAIDSKNLKEIRNLPFFNSQLEYQLIRPVIMDGSGIDYVNSFPAFYEGNDTEYTQDDENVHILSDAELPPLQHKFVPLSSTALNELKKAVYDMSKIKRGALIVLMGNDDILTNGVLTQRGVNLNEKVNADFIEKMFIVGTPLHDGAAIINGDLILRAAAFVKPTSTHIIGKFGARHQAAKGISEISDAIAILVSEENGDVMISIKGSLVKVEEDDFNNIINSAYSAIRANKCNIKPKQETFSYEPIGIHMFKNVDHFHKVHILDDLHLARLEPFINPGDIVYECGRHELEPTKIYVAQNGVMEDGTECTELHDASLPAIFESNIKLDHMDLLYILKDFLKGTLEINDDLLKKLNDYYYPQTVQSYILMPLVIYALRKVIEK